MFVKLICCGFQFNYSNSFIPIQLFQFNCSKSIIPIQFLLQLMASDNSLWCASSWNDLGVQGRVYSPHRLFRTDFFSGLGWMLTADVWDELAPRFPADQWDWWYLKHKWKYLILEFEFFEIEMRKSKFVIVFFNFRMRTNTVSLNRECVVPEISRNRNIGEV